MKSFVTQRRKAGLTAPRAFLLAIGMAAAIPCRAQVYLPATITLDAGAPSNGVKITWQTIPGKNYDVLTAEQPGQAWMATNGGATSLSFIGKLYDESILLAFARAYQNATGFHTNRPPLFIQ
jgi:hypothetical protein